jgi:hypothetical protein
MATQNSMCSVVDCDQDLVSYILLEYSVWCLTFKRRIKSHLPFEGFISCSSYSTSLQDKGYI